MIPYQFRRMVEQVVARLFHATTGHKHTGVSGDGPAITNTAINVAFAGWTPSVTQSGNVTVTINEAQFLQIGKLMHVYAKLTVTGSGTGNNAIVIGNLPTSADTNGYSCKGSAVILDPGTAWYQGSVIIASATTINFVAHNAGDVMGVIPNFALAANDVISFEATYRVA